MQGIRRMKGTAVAAVALVVLVALTGCDFAGSETGTLVISMSPQLTARTIQPELSMDVAYYKISGDGPDDVTFSMEADATESAIVRSSLVPGDWTITVEAYNERIGGATDGDLIGRGSQAVTIAAGEVAELTVTVLPIVGDGFLDVSVTWPESVLTTPVLTASLVPAGVTYNPADHDFPVTYVTNAGGQRIGVNLTDTVATGYYTLHLQLQDNATAVWGIVEAVRIIAGETSSETYNLVEQVNNSGLSLDFTTDLDNPFTVNLSAVTESATDSSLLTAIARVDLAADPGVLVDSWTWYLQGSLIPFESADAASSTVTFGPETVGFYTLTVIADDGGVLSSSSVEFQVQ